VKKTLKTSRLGSDAANIHHWALGAGEPCAGADRIGSATAAIGRARKAVEAVNKRGAGSGPWLPARRFTPAGFSLPFALRGMLTLLLEPMLLERARKSGGPALLQPSFKVQRDATHYQSSRFPSPRVFKGLNARDPLKVHHNNGSWASGSLTRDQRLAPGAVTRIDRRTTARKPNAHQRPS
jgi:hypothetical protein